MDVTSIIIGVAIGQVIGLILAVYMNKKRNLVKELKRQEKDNLVLQMIHNPDNTIKIKAIKMSESNPGMMIPCDDELGGSFYLWQPTNKDIETLEGAKVAHYIRGSTPSVPSSIQNEFDVLYEKFTNYGIIPTQESVICLYDILEQHDDKTVLAIMNQGLPQGEGYVTDWDIDKVKSIRALKKELDNSSIRPYSYQSTKVFLDKSEYNGQSNISAIINSVDQIGNVGNDKKWFGNIDPKYLVYAQIGVVIVFVGMSLSGSF